MWVHVHLAVSKNMGSTYIEIDWPLLRRAQKIETDWKSDVLPYCVVGAAFLLF
jgi:hypothetical protein